MSITIQLATPDRLGEIVEAVADWQHTGGPVQLHPGDLGWNWSFGAQELAEAVRVWIRDGQILAAGMVDDTTGLIRMGIAPSVDEDVAFAAQLVADLSATAQGVLPGGAKAVEARFGAAFQGLLRRSGWVADEPWTPLARELVEQVEDCGLIVEVIDAYNIRDQVVEDRIAVQRAAFANSTFTLERWRAMAAAPPYRRARCLVGYDRDGDAVATTTVWSAGQGRPGLIEPLGVHRDHRGHGYGRAITLAAAAALQEMGASSATVCTPSSNVGGVATYVSAGFQRLPDVTDFRRTS
jgi:ribosomal protein S18 acetylase RimI-like enzyme